MSQIISKIIDTLNEKDILLFRIENSSGAYAEITNYGATLVTLAVPDKNGKIENIILSYNNIEGYFSDLFYLGSTVGRFANRIANAQFTKNGITYTLDKNDGNNSNHGGFTGFNTKVFDYEIHTDRLILSYESKDKEGGFPGNLKCQVIYSFSEDNKLTIQYKAISDQETYFNPTNHAYFNLSAGKEENILNHELKVIADSYLETDNEFIPTGNILSVADSAFDFRTYKSIAQMMPLKKEILPGYNTYFISDSTDEIKYLASLRDQKIRRIVDIYSSMPGIQIYTGDYLSGEYHAFSGICLEAQFYPDGPNHPHFKSCLLKPGEEVIHTIIFSCYSVK